MAATPHSAEIWLVVDPKQDYEETIKVYGVYGSEEAALMAIPLLRRKNAWNRNGHSFGDVFADDRYLEIQHRRGDELVSRIAVPDLPEDGWYPAPIKSGRGW